MTKYLSLTEAREKLKNIEYRQKEIYSGFFDAVLLFEEPDSSKGMALQELFSELSTNTEVSQEKLDLHRKKVAAWKKRKASVEAKGKKFDSPEPELEGAEQIMQGTDFGKIMIGLIIACSKEPNFTEEDRPLLTRMRYFDLLEIGTELMELAGISKTQEEREATFQEETGDEVRVTAGAPNGNDPSATA